MGKNPARIPATAGFGPELSGPGERSGRGLIHELLIAGFAAGRNKSCGRSGCLPCVRPGTPRSRSRRGRRGCIGYKVACRKCGRRPLQQYRCAWRSSYEPPVSGHRHYRQIAKRWTQRSAGQNEMVVSLAVVALLLLLGLLCCVVLVVFLFGRTDCFGQVRRAQRCASTLHAPRLTS